MLSRTGRRKGIGANFWERHGWAVRALFLIPAPTRRATKGRGGARYFWGLFSK